MTSLIPKLHPAGRDLVKIERRLAGQQWMRVFWHITKPADAERKLAEVKSLNDDPRTALKKTWEFRITPLREKETV